METYGLEKMGINAKNVYRNLTPAQLTEFALERKEGKLSNTGALVVTTGKYTGRSPKDKFIVDTDGIHNEIAWGKVNRPISRERFNSIKEQMIKYLEGKDVFIFDGFAGADKTYTQKFRVINEMASQNLFIHQLLIRPTAEELASYGEADYTILCAPGFKCDPERDGVNSEACIAIDYEAHMIIIAGSQYSGEIKKSVFATMNYVMTKKNVLPMHCSANMDPETGETLEPIEELYVDLDDEFTGTVVDKLIQRKGEMIDMRPSGVGKTRIKFLIPTRGLIGYYGEFLTDTRGSGIMNRSFHSYAPHKGPIEERNRGVLVSVANGKAVPYALFFLKDRGTLFVHPGDPVYEGMIIGENSRENELEVNPTKEKQLSNCRAAGKDENIKLPNPREMSLEQAIAYIKNDERVEVTPKSIRLRKKYLDSITRKKMSRLKDE